MSESEAKPQNASLTLGFFGDQEVHRANMKALLDDFIEQFKKSHRNAIIRVIVTVDPFTNTMADIADWALTSGYHLGMIGRAEVFEYEDIAQLVPQTQGLVFKLDDESSIERVLIVTLSRFDENRLILVADPNEDDDAYNALETAKRNGVPVRSLLHGLERVVMETDEDDEQQLHLVEDHDEDEEPPGEEEDEVFVAAEIDLDRLALNADEGDKEAIEELVELAQVDGVDPTQFDTWMEVVVAMRAGEPSGAEDDEGYFDVEAEAETADVETIATEPEPEETEPGPEEEPVTEEEEPPVASSETKYTQKQLERMSLDRLKEIGAPYKIMPGRGMKPSVYVRRILEAQDGATAKTTRRPTKKKAAAKRTPARKKAPTKAAKKTAPKKKAAAPTKAATKKTTRTGTRRTAPVRTSTQQSVNGQLDMTAVRTLFKALGDALIDAADRL